MHEPKSRDVASPRKPSFDATSPYRCRDYVMATEKQSEIAMSKSKARKAVPPGGFRDSFFQHEPARDSHPRVGITGIPNDRGFRHCGRPGACVRSVQHGYDGAARPSRYPATRRPRSAIVRKFCTALPFGATRTRVIESASHLRSCRIGTPRGSPLRMPGGSGRRRRMCELAPAGWFSAGGNWSAGRQPHGTRRGGG